MNTWSLERLICDATRYAKAVAAPVFAPMLDFVYPPLTEPTPKVCRAHHEMVCIFCDEDSDALWIHPADGAEELAEREAEEEVSEPRPTGFYTMLDPEWADLHYGFPYPPKDKERHIASDGGVWVFNNLGRGDWDLVNYPPTDETRERVGEVDDFVPSAPYEPPLSADELVAVRGLIQERYEPNFAGAAASLADIIHRADASVREDKQRDTTPSSATSTPVDPQQTSAHPPAPDSPAGGPPQLAPAGHPNVEPVEDLYREVETFDDGPDLATWLEPAVMTVLDKHIPHPSRIDAGVRCGEIPSGRAHRYCADWAAWHAHVSPLIAKHIAQALPDYPDPQQKGSNQ